MDLKAKEREASAPKFMPAYCDPTNETRGAKYEATRNLSRVEIAKRMRADIKALGLPAGFKVSVTCQSYSGGGSIDIRVTAVPENFRYYTDKAASWLKQFPHAEHRMPMHWEDALHSEWREVRDTLKRVHSSYNRDNSDSSVDYFDTRYYGGVDLDWQLARDVRARDVATSPGNVWAEDCA
jgi:hypothetical protein